MPHSKAVNGKIIKIQCNAYEWCEIPEQVECAIARNNSWNKKAMRLYALCDGSGLNVAPDWISAYLWWPITYGKMDRTVSTVSGCYVLRQANQKTVFLCIFIFKTCHGAVTVDGSGAELSSTLALTSSSYSENSPRTNVILCVVGIWDARNSNQSGLFYYLVLACAPMRTGYVNWETPILWWFGRLTKLFDVRNSRAAAAVTAVMPTITFATIFIT